MLIKGTDWQLPIRYILTGYIQKGAAMDARELRRLEIAESGLVAKKGDIWLISSRCGNGRYSVRFGAGNY